MVPEGTIVYLKPEFPNVEGTTLKVKTKHYLMVHGIFHCDATHNEFEIVPNEKEKR